MKYVRQKRHLSEFVRAHYGLPAVIIGGAPSWMEDFRAVVAGWEGAPRIQISANDHGSKSVTCDYIVACDDLEPRLRQYRTPIISRHTWADIRHFDVPLPNSALLAAWVAYIMGCAPIVIVGVECFQEGTYRDAPKAVSSGQRMSLKEHLKRWDKLKSVGLGGQYRVVSGPLLTLFPTFDPAEKGLEPPSKRILFNKCAGVRVKFLRTAIVGEREYARDEIGEVSCVEERKLTREHFTQLAPYPIGLL